MDKAGNKFPLVLVVWDDAFSVDEWTPIEEIIDETSAVVRSAGFLIKETDKYLILALNHDTTNDNLSCVVFIPTKMVKELIPIDK